MCAGWIWPVRKDIFHEAEFSARSDIFVLFKDQLAESGRQKTKENNPRGNFRLVENDRSFSTGRNFPRGATFSFNWRRVGAKRQKKISFRSENSSLWKTALSLAFIRARK